MIGNDASSRHQLIGPNLSGPEDLTAIVARRMASQKVAGSRPHISFRVYTYGRLLSRILLLFKCHDPSRLPSSTACRKQHAVANGRNYPPLDIAEIGVGSAAALSVSISHPANSLSQCADVPFTEFVAQGSCAGMELLCRSAACGLPHSE